MFNTIHTVTAENETAVQAQIVKPCLPSTVNYHLNRHCNFHCRHCYATFLDDTASHRAMLPKDEMFRVVRALACAPKGDGQRRRKLTFASGEPTLVPWLNELVAEASRLGMATMLVTNGSRLSREYIERFQGTLDWLTLSIDSFSTQTNMSIGRASREGRPISAPEYIAMARHAKSLGIRLKVNTVVNRCNWQEDMGEHVLAVGPERWKILQVTPVEGQNDAHFAQTSITREQFQAFVQRHEALGGQGVTLVPEETDDMRGSYAMVDPQGRFFDSESGRHRYSSPILEAGIQAAFSQVSFDPALFRARGGDYAF